jgi:DNA-binding HxlR family transcriptional regulator
MAQGLTDLSAALGRRMRDIGRLLDRLDRLEAGTGEWRQAQAGAELQAAAEDMALRALRTAADPVNFNILRCLAGESAIPFAVLAQTTGLSRIALNERVSDLVQLGLAAREIDTDQVQANAAGLALYGLIRSIAEATARQAAL